MPLTISVLAAHFWKSKHLVVGSAISDMSHPALTGEHLKIADNPEEKNHAKQSPPTIQIWALKDFIGVKTRLYR
jgi:hypothetical protein